MKKLSYIVALASIILIGGLLMASGIDMRSHNAEKRYQQSLKKDQEIFDKIKKTEKEWREILTAEQYDITRNKGTEAAFSGKYNHHKEAGIYKCVSCGFELFASNSKYDSGSGWPSFYQPIDDQNVAAEVDNTIGMIRTEVACNRCGSHLGHVFDDGPYPTGLHYCINSASLKFEKEKKIEQ